MDTLELPDIQGIIVRGYRMPTVRYFLLQVVRSTAARGVLGRLTSGDEEDAPQITTAEDWHVATPGPSRQRRRTLAEAEAGLLPQRRHYVARAGGTGRHGSPADRSRPDPSTPLSRGAAQRAELSGAHGDSGPKLGGRVRNG